MLDPANTTTSKPPIGALSHGVALVREDLARVERELAELLGSSLPVIGEIGGYIVGAGGKRLRPLLTLLAADAAGLTSPARLTVAAVGELIHTATLLHDDVVDGSDLRRGRPAARYRFGNGLAVLAGDYCLARSIQAIARTGQLSSIRGLAEAVTAMAEGEIAQLSHAGDIALDRATYLRIIDGKTAALLSWCAGVGGLVGAQAHAPLASFGRELGFAFQIADDILDYAADPQLSGKPAAQDLREGKITLPLILACERSPRLRGRLGELLHRRQPLAESLIRPILEEVVHGGGLTDARVIASTHARSAIEHLSHLPPSPARDALAGLALEAATRCS